MTKMDRRTMCDVIRMYDVGGKQLMAMKDFYNSKKAQARMNVKVKI